MYPFHHSVPFNFVNATIRLLLYPVFTEGGKQLCADLEALANECARICNRARSRLEGGSNDLWKGDHQEVKQDCNKQAFLGQETLWQEKRESTAKSESSDFDSSAGFLVEGTPPVGILKEAVFALCMPTGLQQEELDSTLAELGPIFSERLDPSGSLGQQLSDVWGTDEECVRALEQLEQRYAPISYLSQDSQKRAQGFLEKLLEAAHQVQQLQSMEGQGHKQLQLQLRVLEASGEDGTQQQQSKTHEEVEEKQQQQQHACVVATIVCTPHSSASSEEGCKREQTQGRSCSEGNEDEGEEEVLSGGRVRGSKPGSTDGEECSADSNSSSVDGTGSVLRSATQPASEKEACAKVQELLFGLRAHATKRLAEVATAQLQLLLDHGTSLSAPARWPQYNVCGWPQLNDDCSLTMAPPCGHKSTTTALRPGAPLSAPVRSLGCTGYEREYSWVMFEGNVDMGGVWREQKIKVIEGSLFLVLAHACQVSLNGQEPGIQHQAYAKAGDGLPAALSGIPCTLESIRKDKCQEADLRGMGKRYFLCPGWYKLGPVCTPFMPTLECSKRSRDTALQPSHTEAASPSWPALPSQQGLLLHQQCTRIVADIHAAANASVAVAAATVAALPDPDACPAQGPLKNSPSGCSVSNAAASAQGRREWGVKATEEGAQGKDAAGEAQVRSRTAEAEVAAERNAGGGEGEDAGGGLQGKEKGERESVQAEEGKQAEEAGSGEDEQEQQERKARREEVQRSSEKERGEGGSGDDEEGKQQRRCAQEPNCGLIVATAHTLQAELQSAGGSDLGLSNPRCTGALHLVHCADHAPCKNLLAAHNATAYVEEALRGLLYAVLVRHLVMTIAGGDGRPQEGGDAAETEGERAVGREGSQEEGKPFE
eukprot:1159224-Pelagomonas_calceolata.AAC.8